MNRKAPKKESKKVYESSLYLSANKNKIRELWVNAHCNPKMAITLGGKLFKDAKMLAGKNPMCKIISIERDPYIFEKQCKEAKTWPSITPHYGELSDFIDYLKRLDKFDMIWLDYQGIMSATIEQDLLRMFKAGCLNKGAIIGLTLSVSRESIEKLKDTYCYLNVCQRNFERFKQDRAGSISATVINLAQKGGYLVRRLDFRKYQSGTKSRSGSPMMFWLFKIT